MEGQGSIDHKQLQRAVAIASDACPAARLIRKGKDWVDSEIAPPNRVVDAYEYDSSDFSSLQELDDEFDLKQGPTSEVVILRRDPAVLLFRIYHGTMDGRGAVLWIENIFRVMRG